MKSILRGLNRPVFLTLTVFLSVFIGGTTMTAKPSQAFGCSCVPALQNLFKQHLGSENGENCSCIGDKIKKYLGVEETAGTIYKSPVEPEKFRNGGTYKSLTEYFEYVWWPRYIYTQQLIEDSQLSADAVNMSNLSRQADAQTISDTAVRQQERTADILDQHLGVVENSCGDISLITSHNYMREQVRMNKSRISKRLLGRMSGSRSAEGPPVNQGSDLAKKALVEYMISNNMITGQGNNGANEKLGASSEEQVANADSITFQTAIEDPEAAEILLELVSGDIFQDIIRQDNMNLGLTGPLGTVIYDQESYKATVSMLQQPIALRIAEMTPLSGVESMKYLRAAFVQAGYPEDLANSVLGSNGTISKAAADWIVNELRMYDASFQAKKVASDPDNVTRSVLTNMYQQTALLQSLNDTMKNMHMTLATIGLIASDQRKEKVKAKVKSLNGQ